MISLLAIQYVCASKGAQIEAIYPALTRAMEEFGIDTPLRMAMFIAQAVHESGSFRYLEELASGQAYENRAQLGNTQAGDGVRFKGRGVFQVTGRDNYARCSKALCTPSTLLLDSPEKLSEPELACRSAGWFWALKKLNDGADEGDVVGVTRKINGGTNGLDKRMALYKRALFAMDLRG